MSGSDLGVIKMAQTHKITELAGAVAKKWRHRRRGEFFPYLESDPRLGLVDGGDELVDLGVGDDALGGEEADR